MEAEAMPSEQLSVPDPLQNLLTFLSEHELPDDDHSALLYQVHQDLRHVRKWTHLRVLKRHPYSYLAGCAPRMYDSVFPNAEDDEDRSQVVVPISKMASLSPRMLKQYCEGCLLEEGRKPRCITLAIVDDDTTTAYYRIFDTWNEIVHPQWKMKKKEGEEDGDDSVDTDSDDA